MSFEGKVALISGVARGQGRNHALRLAKEGAKIIGFDICEDIASVAYPMATRDDLAETIQMVKDAGSEIGADVGDVRDRASIDAVLAQGLATFGRLDIVIANAGIMPAQGELAKQVSAWHDCLDILLTGVMNTVEASLPTMVKQGDGGSIVIISSMAGLQPTVRTAAGVTMGQLAYGAAKAGLVNLMRNYASYLAEFNIRVNTIHPSGVSTPMIHNEMMDNFFHGAHPQDLLVMVPVLPNAELLQPDDISDQVLFLCSDKGKFITGSEHHVDGGAGLR